MLQQEQKRLGVIAASAGNHALALAYHGSKLSVPVTVVMPIVAPMMKVQLCRQNGATIIVHGADMGEVSDHIRTTKVEYINLFNRDLPLPLSFCICSAI